MELYSMWFGSMCINHPPSLSDKTAIINFYENTVDVLCNYDLTHLSKMIKATATFLINFTLKAHITHSSQTEVISINKVHTIYDLQNYSDYRFVNLILP